MIRHAGPDPSRGAPILNCEALIRSVVPDLSRRAMIRPTGPDLSCGALIRLAGPSLGARVRSVQGADDKLGQVSRRSLTDVTLCDW